MGGNTSLAREIRRMIGGLILMASIFFALSPAPAGAQQAEHFSKKQLRLLMANASKPADFQKLATYFHYQALTYSTKAQKVLEEYANVGSRYPMATKTIPRAEMESRQYREYSAKADENSGLAARYDAILTGFGVKPVSVSSTIVSAKELEKNAKRTPDPAAALMERDRPTGN